MKPAFGDHSRLLDYIDGVVKLPPLPEDVPGDVKGIVVRALAVSPGDRFQSAEQLRAALERALHASNATPADVRKAAAELVSAAAVNRHASPDGLTEATGFGSTKLAVPSLATPEPHLAPSGTLLSEQPRAEPPRPITPATVARKAVKVGESPRVLVLAVVIAAVVTAAAASFAFCG